MDLQVTTEDSINPPAENPPENFGAQGDNANSPAKERVSLLKVGIDIVAQDRLTELVYELLAAGGGQNIVLLSLSDLLRARRKGEYRTYVQNAALVLPISKSLIGGIRFLTGKKAVRYMPFDFVVSLLTILETREFSLYLLGGQRRILQKTEKNIRQTFPRLRIVGRFIGAFKRQEEAGILEAIRKASPSLLLVGKGIRGEEQWIARHTGQLSNGLRLWCSDLYDVFAERRHRPSRKTFDRGMEWIGYAFQNPLRFFRIFPWFGYKILLLWYKLFVK
ncbi:UDP-N-acetyl-D-mannosamine transferase [Spirochaetia bacterium]|nr:UDP-N-acetyl-D-mannosamine transferase [Spirochaetia bacterium]